MPQRLPKVVLVLIVLMAVLSPFMQLDSWDNFPVGTGDIEMHMISVLFETGMFFVIAGILKLFPALLRTGYRPPTQSRQRSVSTTSCSTSPIPLTSKKARTSSAISIPTRLRFLLPPSSSRL